LSFSLLAAPASPSAQSRTKSTLLHICRRLPCQNQKFLSHSRLADVPSRLSLPIPTENPSYLADYAVLKALWLSTSLSRAIVSLYPSGPAPGGLINFVCYDLSTRICMFVFAYFYSVFKDQCAALERLVYSNKSICTCQGLFPPFLNIFLTYFDVCF